MFAVLFEDVLISASAMALEALSGEMVVLVDVAALKVLLMHIVRMVWMTLVSLFPLLVVLTLKMDLTW